MESWIRTQCSFHNYRSNSFKLSQTLKALFRGDKIAKSDTDPFIITEDNGKLFEVKKEECKGGEKGEERIWRRLSLRSFKKRKERKQEEKSKPIIPAVMSTYDKQRKSNNSNNNTWL